MASTRGGKGRGSPKKRIAIINVKRDSTSERRSRNTRNGIIM
jgi:hypothetical protein